MKKCRYCAEEIADEAIKCKHCGSMLVPDYQTQISADISQEFSQKPSASISSNPQNHMPLDATEVQYQKLIKLGHEDPVRLNIKCPKCSQYKVHSTPLKLMAQHDFPGFMCSNCNTIFQGVMGMIESTRINYVNISCIFIRIKNIFTEREHLLITCGASRPTVKIAMNLMNAGDCVFLTIINDKVRTVQNPELGESITFDLPMCYVATYIYGPDSHEVKILRNFRDFYLLANPISSYFVQLYYFLSPVLINIFGKSKIFKLFVSVLLDKILKIVKKIPKDQPESAKLGICDLTPPSDADGQAMKPAIEPGINKHMPTNLTR